MTSANPVCKQVTCCILVPDLSKGEGLPGSDLSKGEGVSGSDSGDPVKKKKCNKKAMRRVSFALSKQIFLRFSQHAPVGSGWTIVVCF